MKEKDIAHESGPYWVGRERKDTFTVYVSGIVASVADSTYANESLAIARCNYLARDSTEETARRRHEALSRRHP